jgi:8-oxo-dGTP pyrophosphatase MutT (NUDIX family)
MLPSVVKKMPWSSDFEINDKAKTVQLIDGSNGASTSAVCNSAFQKTIDTAVDEDIFEIIHRTHSEPYKIIGAKCPVNVERFSAPLFGICTRGAHMTCYTRTSTGEMKIWVGRRSSRLFTYPGKLDTTVAGGVKASHTPFRCIVEEAEEEASLPTDFVKENTKPVGVLTYFTQSKNSGLIHPDVLYMFDLELPETMVPKPNDDEVEEFVLMSVEETKQAMVKGEFKDNCNLVMIDFFVRHGILTAEEEGDYVEIMQRLHRRLPFPVVEGRV